MLINTVNLKEVGSSTLIQALLIIVAWCFALSASNFLLLAQMKVTKEKGTPNRFLIQTINTFLYAPVHRLRPCAE